MGTNNSSGTLTFTNNNSERLRFTNNNSGTLAFTNNNSESPTVTAMGRIVCTVVEEENDDESGLDVNSMIYEDQNKKLNEMIYDDDLLENDSHFNLMRNRSRSLSVPQIDLSNSKSNLASNHIQNQHLQNEHNQRLQNEHND